MAQNQKATGGLVAAINRFRLDKIHFTPKKFFWAFIAVSALLFLYAYLLVPIGEAKKKADEEIALKQRILAKYTEILMSRKSVEASLERTLKTHAELQKRLLSGETPQLGAANLQDVVKRLSEKHQMDLRSFQTLEVKEVGIYRKISLQIDFHPIRSMQDFLQFIDDLENQDKVLVISKMDFHVPNPRVTAFIQGSLVVSGFLKGPPEKEKEKGKKEQK